MQTLQWAMVLRNAYVDPLNVLQAHVLKRLRNEEYANEEERGRLQVSKCRQSTWQSALSRLSALCVFACFSPFFFIWFGRMHWL